MNTLKIWAAAAALVTVTGAAQAGLVSQGDGTVKDDVTNLVWLKDWSYSGDPKTWAAAGTWALDLNYGGYNGWRLPELSEYEALWATVGKTRNGLLGYFDAPIGDYWTNTVYVRPPVSNFEFGPEFGPGFEPGFGPGPGNEPPVSTEAARRLFSTYAGDAGFSGEMGGFLAMAVRVGDEAAAVPEPGSMALFGLALMGLAGTRRRLR
jgi:hypothetical protein